MENFVGFRMTFSAFGRSDSFISLPWAMGMDISVACSAVYAAELMYTGKVLCRFCFVAADALRWLRHQIAIHMSFYIYKVGVAGNTAVGGMNRGGKVFCCDHILVAHKTGFGRWSKFCTGKGGDRKKQDCQNHGREQKLWH